MDTVPIKIILYGWGGERNHVKCQNTFGPTCQLSISLPPFSLLPVMACSATAATPGVRAAYSAAEALLVALERERLTQQHPHQQRRATWRRARAARAQGAVPVHGSAALQFDVDGSARGARHAIAADPGKLHFCSFTHRQWWHAWHMSTCVDLIHGRTGDPPPLRRIRPRNTPQPRHVRCLQCRAVHGHRRRSRELAAGCAQATQAGVLAPRVQRRSRRAPGAGRGPRRHGHAHLFFQPRRRRHRTSVAARRASTCLWRGVRLARPLQGARDPRRRGRANWCWRACRARWGGHRCQVWRRRSSIGHRCRVGRARYGRHRRRRASHDREKRERGKKEERWRVDMWAQGYFWHFTWFLSPSQPEIIILYGAVSIGKLPCYGVFFPRSEFGQCLTAKTTKS